MRFNYLRQTLLVAVILTLAGCSSDANENLARAADAGADAAEVREDASADTGPTDSGSTAEDTGNVGTPPGAYPDDPVHNVMVVYNSNNRTTWLYRYAQR